MRDAELGQRSRPVLARQPNVGRNGGDHRSDAGPGVQDSGWGCTVLIIHIEKAQDVRRMRVRIGPSISIECVAGHHVKISIDAPKDVDV